MKLGIRLIIAALLAACVIGTVWLRGTVWAFNSMVSSIDDKKDKKPKHQVLRARAIVRGAPGSGIEGVVTFTQRNCPNCPPSASSPAKEFADFPEPTVEVEARIQGLTPGPHGMHIHENGSCGDTTIRFGAAGGHFDPGPNSNPSPDANHPFHMGDIPNIVANEKGVGRLNHITSRITLSPGPLSVFDENGSAVIVHMNLDQGITGPAGSGVSGGARIACGVIEQVSGEDKDDKDDKDDK